MGERVREGLDRRGFLRTGALLAAGGVVAGGSRPAAAAQLPKRQLGRTGLDVTCVSFGALQLQDQSHVRVLEHAIDLGMNLVHVSPGYTNGQAIKIVGEVMARKRDKVHLALKVGPWEGEVDRCLQILNTDHVEILVPPVNDAAGAQNPRLRDGFMALKAKGKIRACGFACFHEQPAEALQAAIEAGWWDCFLLGYNIENRATFDPLIARAVQEQNMGFLVMKSSRGLPRNNPDLFDAGLRDLLKNTNLTSLTIGIGTVQHVEQNIAALLRKDARADREFARYAAACAGKFCDQCGKCQAACAQGVAVGEYLRAAIYLERGDSRLARQVVETIPPRRSLAACTRCGACDGACPRNLDVVARMRSTVG